MKTTAYIQKVNGEFSNVNFYMAWLAFTKFFGYKVEFFEAADVDNLPITKDTPVYAGVPIMDKIFKKLGRTVLVPYYPSELIWFLGRAVDKRTLNEVRWAVEEHGRSYFIKPVEQEKKLFTGHVVSEFKDLIVTAQYSPEKIVYASQPVKFISEYRIFVHKDSGILGAKHYAGDWSVAVNRSVVEEAMKAYTKSPIAYSLDMGVTDTGKTLLVECNDATSLGCYGLDASCYGRMILDRWNEIVK